MFNMRKKETLSTDAISNDCKVNGIAPFEILLMCQNVEAY